MRTTTTSGIDAYQLVCQTVGGSDIPFVIGSSESIDSMLDNMEMDERESDDIVQESLMIDPLEVLDDLKNEHVEDGYEAPEDFSEIIGEWPGQLPAQGLVLHTNILTGAPLDKAVIGYADVQHRWMIPAFLKFGNWNDCPAPEIHCAIHRYWGEKYGAEIIGFSGDVIECSVMNPPINEDQAMQLAMQQFAYCYDIVEQGTETIANLAASLVNSKNWYFWWD